MNVTGAQIRMARGCLRWSVADLAERSGVGRSTIKRAELVDGEPPITRPNLNAIRTTLEAAGVRFTFEGGGSVGILVDVRANERVAQKNDTA